MATRRTVILRVLLVLAFVAALGVLAWRFPLAESLEGLLGWVQVACAP